MKKLQLLCAIILCSISVKAQSVAMNTSTKLVEFNKENSFKSEISPLLEETTYTYKYKDKDVLVVITEDEHIEYFNDGKYFIKSSIDWVSDNECYMTLKDANLPNFPFKEGTELKFKITKIKKGKIFYESTLGGRTWTGKMKQL